MNTTDPHTPDDHTDDAAAGVPAPASPTAKQNSAWSFAWLLVLPLFALVNSAVSPLFSAALSGRIPAVLDFDEPTAITIGGVDLAVEGMTTLSIPLAELSTWAIAQFIVAKALWVIGLLVATWFAARALTEVVRGRPFSDRVARGLAGLSWTVVAVGLVTAVAQVPADNLIIRDLALQEEPVGNSITRDVMYLWVGAGIFVEVLRRAVRRGRETQDELEGVI